MRAVTARYRLLVLSRIVVAALGGYALASAMAVLLALVWPLPRAEAVMASTLLGFVWYAVAVIWVFSVRSVLRAWVGILGVTAVLSLLCWLLSGSAP
ncbi:FIG024006: iron uptake protein [plant metagenome]|uniref:FIG024006: iron uptake protein n=1 Tax=plant metagenome TaxID=1297885 RepID=A0A484T6R3_9ZZZZ